ncbi:VCBS repeat-containing protein [Okeania sp. KiyG1]|uniref:FG-GAP repeat domain-containing protein n=1 Tax=Okeania sp. KiyG1 TaxID=2720165 RepID=UPI001920596F|nr:VCBS repeat-containing protein [Okeania sp. KiyG1]GGA27392.1 hypothetical protein CYANOKiyG1_43580 [Okeania sp. KiyG1]
MSNSIEKTIKNFICLLPSHLIEQLKKVTANIHSSLLLGVLVFLGVSCLWLSPANALTNPPDFQEIVVDDNLKDGYWLEAVDVNNDSQPDLVTSGLAIGEIAWYENPGDFTAQSEWKKHPMITLPKPHTNMDQESEMSDKASTWSNLAIDGVDNQIVQGFLGIADFDGDGYDEFIISERSPNPLFQGIIYYHLIGQEGATAFFERTTLSVSSFNRIAVEDFDGDGKIDFATTKDYAPGSFSAGKPQLMVFLNRIGSSAK